MSLSLSKLKKGVQSRGDLQALLPGQKKSHHRAPVPGLLDDNTDDLLPMTMPKTTSSKRSVSSVAASAVNYRVPRISLAARLEAELMALWNFKNAFYFWKPVDVIALPSYATRVHEPIDLSRIRGKIARYEYEKAGEMLSDVRLMARNSEVFNGPKHLVTVVANKLVDKLQKSLAHEGLHLGADKDTIRIMEDAIQKKAALLRAVARTSAAGAGVGGVGVGGGGGGF